MKKQFFLVVLLAVFSLVLAQQNASAQEGISTYSTVNYDAANNTVSGYSYTYATYGNSGYYDTQVTSYIADSDDNVLDSGTYLGRLNASILLAATGTGCGEYRIVSSHSTVVQYYVTAYFYNNDYRDGYYDLFDYLQFSEQGQSYPLTASFFAPAVSTVSFLNYSEIILGSTENTSSGNCAPPQVQKIQYQEPNSQTFTDITGTLYILKDTTVTFKAVPQNSRFPSGQPVWSGTSGATGTGITKSVAFNTTSSSLTNYQTVTATSGSNPVTVNVIVYELTGVLTPKDNFTNRSLIKFGLQEEVDLSFTVNPAVNVTQAGGLGWAVQTGTGTIPARTDGTGVFTGPETAESSVLKLEVLNGPSKGGSITVNITIVAPSGGYEMKIPNTGIYHTQGSWSVGFLGWIRLDPKDVSFKKLTFRELEAWSKASGYLVSVNNIKHNATPQTIAIDFCNALTGCRVVLDDQVQSEIPGPAPTPYANGDFLWEIPWKYYTDNGSVQFTKANHHSTSDSSGNASVEKAGAGPYTKNVSDANSSY